MAYLVDSDWVIDYLAGDPKSLAVLERLAEQGIAISVITYMEVFQGVERSEDPGEAERRLNAFLEEIPILPISPSIARRCARLREALRREGRRVNQRALDLLNAAIALEYRLTIVTRNVVDYADVPGIHLESP